MRTGALDQPATLAELRPDLTANDMDWIWIGIRAKDDSVPAPAGLKSPARITVRAWWDQRLMPGRYLRTEDRLLHIDSVRDVTGRRTEATISATELVGQPATYTSPAGLSAPCRVYLAHGVTRPGELTGRAEYTTQIEAALIEVGRPQPGGVFNLGGQAWRVAGLVEDDDDSVTRRMWVKPA